MLPSATSSIIQPSAFEAGNFTPRRIRHITSIQIRNLTPFPLRDTVTSALAQPIDQSNLNVSGTADDTANVITRKRPRKASSNSTGSRRVINIDEELFDAEISFEPRGRKASTSTIPHPSNKEVSITPDDTTLVLSTSSRSSNFRRMRPRTNSMASFGRSTFSGGVLPNTSSATSSFLLRDHSQSVLKKVIDSRLIETFVVVFLTQDHEPESKEPQIPLRSAPISKSSFSSTSHAPKAAATHSRQNSVNISQSRSSKTQFSLPESAPPSRTSFKPPATSSKDVEIKQAANVRSPGMSTTTSTMYSMTSKNGEPTRFLEHVASLPEFDTPIYFSEIHRPSTNPVFPLDTRSGLEIPSSVDTSSQRLRIEIWGNLDNSGSKDVTHLSNISGQPHEDELYGGWRMLDEWEVELNRLVPLHDGTERASSLPSNTLVISLSPPDRLFYLPSSSPTSSSSSTPNAGYTSDPELAVRKAKQLDNNVESDIILGDKIIPLSRRRLRIGNDRITEPRSFVKTAGWQDLFKLVTLQSCILDSELSVGDVILKIEKIMEDKIFPMKRLISEMETRIQDLEQNHSIIQHGIQKRRREINERRDKLKQRRKLLKNVLPESVVDSRIQRIILEERDRSAVIHQRIDATRTSLLSGLSVIYPIELFSPPDLLFTILDVPLPIPLTSNDPAPPLTLPNHKEVNEESVATALGYVAQVLQILAAYIGKKLTYPVTCIGSRSLIRDGISSMVGPRMFPLFSKGVDTYRYEYGVFLLNKNIEMLMSERNLRALDIRHTLPNLKNLLLTLSHDGNPPPRPIQRSHSPLSVVSDLETPSRESSPVNDDSNTPKASRIMDKKVLESTVPLQSGSITPVALSDDPRKPKSFLGFVPFSDYLWTRNSSSNVSDTNSSSTGDDADADDDDDDDDDDAHHHAYNDEDDRTTIHAASENPDYLPDTTPTSETLHIDSYTKH